MSSRASHKHKLASNAFGIAKASSSRALNFIIIAMPLSAFALGTWQVQRRRRKLAMIDDATLKLNSTPISAIATIQDMKRNGASFDNLPIKLTGNFRHDDEMLVGPRQHDGQTGFHVITPFTALDQATILVNRGWIAKQHQNSQNRKGQAETEIFGLTRQNAAKNMFTPSNDYERGLYYFVDIDEMSRKTNSEPLLLEITTDPRFSTEELAKTGVPIGKPHEVLLKNNHLQYIITWYSLAIATTLMSLSLFRKKRMTMPLKF